MSSSWSKHLGGPLQTQHALFAARFLFLVLRRREGGSCSVHGRALSASLGLSLQPQLPSAPPTPFRGLSPELKEAAKLGCESLTPPPLGWVKPGCHLMLGCPASQPCPAEHPDLTQAEPCAGRQTDGGGGMRKEPQERVLARGGHQPLSRASKRRSVVLTSWQGW